jgi:pyruvate/2-oxoacid:ferredoxin oxidoreductase beta subunit/Fe-S-cluster-containing hydrogenase component 2
MNPADRTARLPGRRIAARPRQVSEPGENPLLKEAGEPKEHHEGRLGLALPLFDIDGYVEEFNRSIVSAYRLGTADAGLPADVGLARSIVPPGTAASRDFSYLALQIPEFVREACVGCMSCVSACPDSAILAVALPVSVVAAEEARFAASEADPALALETARSHFTDTQKYGEVPARRGHERGAFGIFVDPVHCKGCAECVEVCHDLGYDALFMIDKVAEEPRRVNSAIEAVTASGPARNLASREVAASASGMVAPPGESTLERFSRDMRFFRSLPPTPPEYRNERALADLMLGEHAIGYVGGAGSCAGCGEASAIRMLVAATRQIHGPQSMGIVAATGCNTVFGGTYPFNPYLVPWTNSLFENAPAVALGIRARWDATGHPERRLWVLGGDGAMYDIGFQSLSRMLASGADIKVLVLDTQVYSNTGGQASTASFGGQVTKLSAFGREIHGRPERRKELGRILIAHGDVYVAQTTPAHINHFYRSVMEANTFPGPAVLIVYTPCQPEHGIPDDASNRQSRLAVNSRAFPLFTYDPRRGARISDRLSLQGNPALKADWATDPDGTAVDFLAFARTEGRFGPHFTGPDGTPSVEIEATQEDRLGNWRTLQELAGA